MVNPVAFTIDEKGRVWVVECFEYPSRTPKGKAPRDRIVILEDTDGDGVCDKRTVFAEGKDFPVPAERKAAGLGAFDMASGIEVGHGGVFVGAPPYLWFIENKNDKPGGDRAAAEGVRQPGHARDVEHLPVGGRTAGFTVCTASTRSPR